MLYFTFPSNKIAVRVIFVHGWEFILRESVYYGKKEQFYLIPFLCPVWNIAADYFRPITFSVPGTEVMVEKILSIGQQAGAGAGHQTLLSQSHNYAPALHRYFRHHKQTRGRRAGKSISEQKLSGREAKSGLVRLSNVEAEIEKIIWFNFLISCSQFSHVRAGARDPIKS